MDVHAQYKRHLVSSMTSKSQTQELMGVGVRELLMGYRGYIWEGELSMLSLATRPFAFIHLVKVVLMKYGSHWQAALLGSTAFSSLFLYTFFICLLVKPTIFCYFLLN